MSTPRVSIIVPTHNRAKLIGRAIDSVVRQTFPDWELIIVDDGSTDETGQVIESYRGRIGERLVYLTRQQGGSSAARNTGIERARGEFVAFLDADDEFLPHKLARQLELFELEPGLDFVYSDYAFVDLNGVRHLSALSECHPLGRQVPTRQVGPNLHVCTGDLADYLLRGYFICTIVGMVRRNALGSDLRFLEGQWYSEEWLFYLEVARRCRSGYVDEPLSVHHYEPGSVSRTSVARNLVNQKNLLAIMAKRFPHCSPEARRALRRQRSFCAQQLGWDALRTGRSGQALGHFAEAFVQTPGWATARPTVGAAWKYLTHSTGGKAGPPAEPVRR